jgi:putative transposase
MHSDQGWQYQHEFYRSELKKQGIIQSMSRKSNCYDNSIMETFLGRMKNEMYYGSKKEYTLFKVFAKAVREYIHYFKKERIQEKTKWMPPEIYRETSTNAI